jgi:ATP-dependent Clp protease protease subunit
MKKIYALVIITALFGCTIAESKNESIVLSENNLLILDSEVSEASVAKIMQEALKLDESLPKNKPIYLVLDTPGGSVDSGLSLITTLQGLGRPVHTITMFAASMGFQIAQNLNDRLILPNGVLMSHHARGGVQGEFGGAKGSQIEKRMEWIISTIDRMDRQTVLRTNGKKTLEQYQQEYENELWSLSDHAVKNGYADRVVIPKCAKDLSGTKETESSFFGMKITLVVSKCPLVRGILDVKTSIKTNDGKWVPVNEFEAKGGIFGANCPSVVSKSMCAADPSLNPTQIELIKNEVIKKNSTEWKKQNVVFKM